MRPDRDPQPVRRFECFTADLHRLADWLPSCGVQTAALQSTGVYWIPLYDIQLANVISDLSVVTGQMIVRAVVAGERDLRIQASRGGNCQKPGRQRAPKAALCAATRNRDVRPLPAPGHRV
jgi:hypothetical protein